MKKENTTTFFFFFFTNIPNQREKEERTVYVLARFWVCVCVCWVSVLREKREGMIPLVWGGEWEEKTRHSECLFKKRRRRRWFGGCWPSRKNGTAESFFTKKCYATFFFFVRVCDVTLHHLRITASSYSWLITFFFHKLATPTRLLYIPNGSFPASPQTQENLNEAKEMVGGIATKQKKPNK